MYLLSDKKAMFLLSDQKELNAISITQYSNILPCLELSLIAKLNLN